jgi:hypothetical protein
LTFFFERINFVYIHSFFIFISSIVPHDWTAATDCRIAGLQDCRIAGLQDCRIAGLQDCRIAGLQDCRIAGLQSVASFFLSFMQSLFRLQKIKVELIKSCILEVGFLKDFWFFKESLVFVFLISKQKYRNQEFFFCSKISVNTAIIICRTDCSQSYSRLFRRTIYLYILCQLVYPE